VLIGPVTPLLRRTADKPRRPGPTLIDANYAAVAANVPKWCADFEAAGPHFGTSPGASPGLVDWTIRMIVDTPFPVLLETLTVNADVDMRAELPKIQVPALIVHGDQDASAPIELTGRKTAELIGGASLTVYPAPGMACTPATTPPSTPTCSPSSTTTAPAWPAAPCPDLSSRPARRRTLAGPGPARAQRLADLTGPILGAAFASGLLPAQSTLGIATVPAFARRPDDPLRTR
jgi:hypothetical protein